MPVEPAGGTDDGRVGTSFDKIERAIQQVLEEGDGALVLTDLGSAVMVTEMAVEHLSPELQERVRLSNAPLVEGAIAAVSAAAGGADLEAVKRAAEQALETPKVSEETETEPAEAPEEEAPAEEAPQEAEEAEARSRPSGELEVTNPAGLHARPAARFVHLAMRFEANVSVKNVTHDRPPANAKSMMEVASRGTAWQGERIRIEAQGEDAEEAIAALRELVESGFGEREQEETREKRDKGSSRGGSRGSSTP